MATKTADKKGGEATDAPQTDSPLLDLSDAAVKRMIKLAKKRGFVTHEELNEVLPSEEVSSDQIEDVFAMLNEMGITVSEAEEDAEGVRVLGGDDKVVPDETLGVRTRLDLSLDCEHGLTALGDLCSRLADDEVIIAIGKRLVTSAVASVAEQIRPVESTHGYQLSFVV